jgi:hypothetical protein
MSEVRDTVDLESNEVIDDAEVEEAEAEAPEGEDDEDGERQAKPAVDWRKRAQDKEGQAAKERSLRRAAQRQVAELSERLERLETQTTTRQPSRRQQLIAQLREDSEDPLADLDGLKEVARALLEEDVEQQQTRQQQQAAERYYSALTSNMTDFEADFRTAHPDYDKACDFYKGQRTEELEDLGYVGERLNRKLAEEVYGLVGEAMKAGRDPAEAVYALAKRRGFAGGKDDATAKLQKLAKGAAAGTGPRGATTGSGRVTYEQVTRAKGAERDKLWAALRRQETGAKK